MNRRLTACWSFFCQDFGEASTVQRVVVYDNNLRMPSVGSVDELGGLKDG